LNDVDKDWEYFGSTEPYYGVWTHNDFRLNRLNPEARERFFSSGRRHIGLVLETVRSFVDPNFQPIRSLDFGCGVGRLVIPLASQSKSVVGVDISPSMLAEAHRNCEFEKIDNVTLVQSDDSLSGVSGLFNLIHSYIVFQHIPPNRGEVIMQHLIDRLEIGGVGVLHFTYYYPPISGRSRLLLAAYRFIPFVHNLRNMIKGRPFNEPTMQNYGYNMNRLMQVLQENQCHRCHLHFTHHGPYGVILFFQKKSLELL
jgi:SAM-dependent methyltransferase